MSEREERLAVLLRERFGDMSRAKRNPREEVPSFSAARRDPSTREAILRKAISRA